MDVCTLIIVNWMNTIGCMKIEECYIKNDKKICVPSHSIGCPVPEQTYKCKKENGIEYILKQSELN